MKNKRGISPLIATVLLIGFTIAIAVLVFVFLKGQVTDLTAKFGAEQFTAEEEATTTFTVPSCKIINNQLTLQVNNQGKLMLDCFWIVPKNQEAVYYTWNIKPGEQDERTLTIAPTVSPTEVEIYPCLIRAGKIKTGKAVVKVTC